MSYKSKHLVTYIRPRCVEYGGRFSRKRGVTFKEDPKKGVCIVCIDGIEKTSTILRDE